MKLIPAFIRLLQAKLYSNPPFRNPKKALYFYETVEIAKLNQRQMLFYIEMLHEMERSEEALQLLETYKMKLESNVSYYLLHGRIYQDQDKDEKALPYLNKTVEMEPDIGVCWYALAISNKALGNFEDAVYAFNKAIELEDKESAFSTWYELGVTYMLMEDYENAKEAFKQSLSDVKNAFPFYYFKLAEAYRFLGEKEKERENLVKAVIAQDELSAAEDQGESYYISRYYSRVAFNTFHQEATAEAGFRLPLFYLLKEEGHIEEAENVLNMAIKFHPKQLWLYIQRGILYKEQQQYEKAITQFKYIIETEPTDGNSYFYLSETYMELEQFQKAIDVYTDAIKYFPTSDFFYFERCKTYIHVKELQKALEDVTKAIEISENDSAEYYFERSYIYYNLGQYERSLEELQRVAKIDESASSSLEYNNALGNVYKSLDVFDLAIESFTFCIDKYKEVPVYLYERRAECFIEIENFPLALEDCHVGLQIEPNNLLLLWLRGMLHLRLEKPVEALSDALKYAELQPENPASYFNLGVVYEELNDTNSALKAYTNTVAIEERYEPAYIRRAYLYNKQLEKEKCMDDLYSWLMFVGGQLMSPNEKIQLLEEISWIESDMSERVKEKFISVYGTSDTLLS